MEPAQQVDTPEDFGDSPSAVVSRWVSELELSEKQQRPWVERGRRIVRRYVDDRAEANDVRKRRFALLWANIQTLAPTIYARTPTAVVSRRWRDADPVGRTASEVIERALNFSLDASDFADIMTALRDEYLLVGRGQAWVRYVPHIRPVAADPAPSPDGEVTDDADQYDEVIWEEAVCDHVHWEDFGTNPARTWSEVRFVWRRCFMTRDELVDRFGDDKGKACPLDWKADGESDEGDKDIQFAKAAVYEIWDKVGRQVLWICKAYTEDCLDVRDDPLGLKDFFPCPRPLLASCGPDSIIPTPDYTYYEGQAQEINELTRRIGLLTDALKVRGFYAGTENTKLTDLLAAETNTLVPIDSWATLADKGGMAGVVQWFPVDMVAGVLKSCIETRQQMLDDVFQITGIADIMRGDTDPDETASAQQIKATWGSSRVRDKQRELSRFARDLLRIMGEVVAQKFSTDTLARMTGVQLLPSPAARQALIAQTRMQAAAAQAPSRPPFQLDPTLARMLSDPTWAEIEAVLRDNASRTFRIEIETDSTIEPNDQDEKQRRVEFVQAVGLYLEKTLSVVQLAPEMLPVVVEGLKFLVRGFRVGREMEDVIDQALDQLQARAAVQQPAPPHQGPDPQAEQLKAQAATTNAQANVARAQAQQHRAATESFKAQSDAQIGMAQIAAENQRTDADRAASLSMNADQVRAGLQQALLSASQRRLIRDINNDAPMETPDAMSAPRCLSGAAALALLLAAQPAASANLTPDQLTQATSAGATDLLLLYPTGGPMKSVQWSVVTSLMQSALGGTFLQVGDNLADVNSPSSARNNLGLGTAATQNTGTSGATLPFLNGANTWSGAQTFNGKLTLFASASSGAPLNIPQGAAPNAPANGDCWTTSADLFCALGGATQAYLSTTSAASTYAPLASPALTGTPTAPTAANGTNTTQIATTAFVLANAGGAPCTSTNGALQYDNSGAFGCAPMTATSSNVSMSAATFTPSTTKGIVGTAAADNAQTGSVGEYVSSNVARASAVSLTSNTAANVTSVSLTAGDWDCRGNVAFIAGSSPSQEIAAIGTMSATLPALPDSGGETRLTLAIGTADDTAISAGTIRENVSSTTSVFLIGDATFTGSSSAYGFLGCRRVR